jgi:hypothetical protein
VKDAWDDQIDETTRYMQGVEERGSFGRSDTSSMLDARLRSGDLI